jgi:hypothetical protein
VSRIARFALPVVIALALTAVAGLDIRLALATRDLTVETTAALDEHERRMNGRSDVTRVLDAHERHAANLVGSTVTFGVPTKLDAHERRAVEQVSAGGTSSVPARLDEHERRAAAR